MLSFETIFVRLFVTIVNAILNKNKNQPAFKLYVFLE